jgi:hypothetical protein
VFSTAECRILKLCVNVKPFKGGFNRIWSSVTVERDLQLGACLLLVAYT